MSAQKDLQEMMFINCEKVFQAVDNDSGNCGKKT
jgi:hypothetical protein